MKLGGTLCDLGGSSAVNLSDLGGGGTPVTLGGSFVTLGATIEGSLCDLGEHSE